MKAFYTIYDIDKARIGFVKISLVYLKLLPAGYVVIPEDDGIEYIESKAGLSASIIATIVILSALVCCLSAFILWCYRRWRKSQRIKKFVVVDHNLITLPRVKAFYEKVFMYAESFEK